MTDIMKIFILDRENSLLRMENENLKANIDYNIMMGNLEDPSEDDDDE